MFSRSEIADQVDPLNHTTGQKALERKLLHGFVVYMVYMPRFVHWIAIDSLVSKRAFWFPTIHPRNHDRFYAVTTGAMQTTTTRYNGAHTSVHTYTSRDTIPTQSRSQSIPLNQIVRNGNTVQIVLIYSFQEKFRTGASDKIETHRPSYIIQRNQTALSAWWKISEKLSITMRTTMIELRLTPSSFNAFYLR